MSNDISQNLSGGDSIPYAPSESAGSSVSSRLQDEYESLLKYAMVTPAGMFHGSNDNLSDDQIRLQRTSTDIRATDMPRSPALDRDSTLSPSVCDIIQDELYQPTPMGQTYNQRQSLPKVIENHSNTVSTTNTTEGEQEKEKEIEEAVRIRVFGSLVNVATPSQTLHDNYTLDDLDTSSKEDVEEVTDSLSNDETMSPTHDSDLVRLETKLEEWSCGLRQNILAELTQIKLRLLQQQKARIMDEREKSGHRLARITREGEELKELVATCERNIAQKDGIITNLTASLQKQKTKGELMRSFHAWKLRHCDEKREDFACKIAAEWNARRVLWKSFRAWQSVVEGKWKERVERACQNRAQEVCEQLTRDYEGKIAQLQRQLGHAHAEIAGMRADREQFEERMKKGFMRGVCALNLEAMTMFKEEEAKENCQPDQADMTRPVAPDTVMRAVPVQSEHPLPNYTTAPHLGPPVPQSRPVSVRVVGSSALSKPGKPSVPPREVLVERHPPTIPSHHPPARPPTRLGKPRNKMSVKIVE